MMYAAVADADEMSEDPAIRNLSGQVALGNPEPTHEPIFFMESAMQLIGHIGRQP